MKAFLSASVAALALAAAAPAQAADYRPTGPQTNVALATVTGGGWTLCYSGTMGTSIGTSASAAVAGCAGDQLMLAGRATGSDTLLALAWAPRVDALFGTGAADNGVFHEANGSNWFNADNYSWGFLTAGQTMEKNQCAFDAPDASMCVHTLGTVGGYSINTIVNLNNSSEYETLVFSANAVAAVPEPATWGLMLLGFGLVGTAMRRGAGASAIA